MILWNLILFYAFYLNWLLKLIAYSVNIRNRSINKFGYDMVSHVGFRAINWVIISKSEVLYNFNLIFFGESYHFFLTYYAVNMVSEFSFINVILYYWFIICNIRIFKYSISWILIKLLIKIKKIKKKPIENINYYINILNKNFYSIFIL